MASKQETADQAYETAEPAAITPAVSAKADTFTKADPIAPVVNTAPPVSAKVTKPVSTVRTTKITAKTSAPKAVSKPVKRKVVSPETITPKAAAAKPRPKAASVSKGQLNMNDMVTKFAEQAKASAEAFSADFGKRAEEAMAKSSKLAEEAAAFNKSNVEAVVESSKIAVKNLETLREESLSFARKSFEDSSSALKSLTSVKSPAEFFKLYAENSKKAFETAIAQTSKNSEMLVKMSGDSFAPISNRMSVISSQMKVA